MSHALQPGEGHIPGEFPQGDDSIGTMPRVTGGKHTVRFQLAPFLGIISVAAEAAFGMLVSPLTQTTQFLIPTGISLDLNEAVQNCVRAAIALLQARFGIDAAHTYAYLSATTDLAGGQPCEGCRRAYPGGRLQISASFEMSTEVLINLLKAFWQYKTALIANNLTSPSYSPPALKRYE